MVYRNIITPNRAGAGFFVGQANEKVKAIVSAVKKYIEKEKTEDAELLSHQLKALHTALDE
jgi:hypothetical protein